MVKLFIEGVLKAMAKEFTAEVKEWVGPVKESKTNNWCKYVAKVSYNNKPANIDIRNVKFNPDGSHLFGKGISLTDEECDTMVDILLEKGYGTRDAIEKALKKKDAVFGDTVNIFVDDDEEEEEYLKIIEICGKE